MLSAEARLPRCDLTFAGWVTAAAVTVKVPANRMMSLPRWIIFPTLKEIDSRKIGLAGYSFGGMVADAVATKDKRVKQLALISPVLGAAGWAQLKEYSQPKLILIGDEDTTIVFRPFQKKFGDARQYQLIAGADHFWSGFEKQISDKIACFIRDGFSKT